jgi:hypothetical protein
MMPSVNVLRWMNGRGWIVLSGGADDDIRGTAINRSSADGGIACVALSGAGDPLIDGIVELGAPSAYLVDLLTEDDQSIRDKLSEAGVVLIDSAPTSHDARSMLRGAAIEGIQEAYDNGAVILIEGASAAAFGTWLVEGSADSGLEWIDGAVVLDGIDQAAARARPVFDLQPSAVAIAVQRGSALALGPEGQVEAWGAQEVTIALGPAYTG